MVSTEFCTYTVETTVLLWPFRDRWKAQQTLVCCWLAFATDLTANSVCVCESSPTGTMSLPKCYPSSRPMKAPGAFSSPSKFHWLGACTPCSAPCSIRGIVVIVVLSSIKDSSSVVSTEFCTYTVGTTVLLWPFRDRWKAQQTLVCCWLAFATDSTAN